METLRGEEKQGKSSRARLTRQCIISKVLSSVKGPELSQKLLGSNPWHPWLQGFQGARLGMRVTDNQHIQYSARWIDGLAPRKDLHICSQCPDFIGFIGCIFGLVSVYNNSVPMLWYMHTTIHDVQDWGHARKQIPISCAFAQCVHCTQFQCVCSGFMLKLCTVHMLCKHTEDGLGRHHTLLLGLPILLHGRFKSDYHNFSIGLLHC